VRRRTTTLYRLYAADDELLYVGIAGNPSRRFQDHAGSKSWWRRVVTIQCEHFRSRRHAERAEQAAIFTEQPRWNVLFNESAEIVDPASEIPYRLIYPPHEAAVLLDVETADVCQMIRSGDLPAITFGREPRVRREVIEAVARVRESNILSGGQG
jgi:hypothetical protein